MELVSAHREFYNISVMLVSRNSLKGEIIYQTLLSLDFLKNRLNYLIKYLFFFFISLSTSNLYIFQRRKYEWKFSI